MNKLDQINQEKKIASYISLGVGIVLLVMKFYAYHITNSKAIFSDALESIVNVVAGIVTTIVLVVAARPADNDHPYGHGKVESMAASFEGGAISFAGVLIIIEGIKSLIQGVTLNRIEDGIIFIAIAGAVNGLTGFLIFIKGKRLHSEALRSSGTHLMTDALTTVGVVIGLALVSITKLSWIDPVIAIIFGALLIIGGIKILIESGNTLLDAHDANTVKLVVDNFEKNYRVGIIDIHFTRIIRSGPHHHIDCHMVVPEFWAIDQCHTFADKFESNFMTDYPVGCELHVHLDPCRRAYCSRCELADCQVRTEKLIERKPFQVDRVIAPTEMA